MPPEPDSNGSRVSDDELTIPVLRIPDFKESIPAEDIPNLEVRDVKVLLKLSRFAQQLDWSCDEKVIDNQQKRRLEKRILVSERELKSLKDWRRGILTLRTAFIVVITALTTGLVGAVCRLIVEKLFGTRL